ncbi:MAG: lyase family protein, partial [Bacteroidales bacterium]|nr:lyase family protein [Bacteroidales bacterium]
MELSQLSALSPIDGRYRKQVADLAGYFSEYALIRYRLQVEVEYFLALCQWPLPQLSTISVDFFTKLQDIYLQFNLEDAKRIKEIEKTTNHDVKAVEYFIRERFAAIGLDDYNEFVHFGLTSQDINNTAIPLSLMEALYQIYLPVLEQLELILTQYAQEWAFTPMLAHTHGQPASPTRLGKEVEVFVVRLNEQISLLKQIPMAAKFGGATGNLNAHYAAYPHIDWHRFAQKFVEEQLKLKRSAPTTQIE